MLDLDPSALARVLGGADEAGPNRTQVRKPSGEETTTYRSDRAYCLDRVTQLCRDANPGMLWGTNEAGAAKCAIDAIPKACPTPAQPGS